MIVLTVLALLGLLVFIVFGLYWLFMPTARTQAWPAAMAGLVIWAIATLIAGIIALF